MKKDKITFFFMLMFSSELLAEPIELPPISFGGGVDYKTACSDIRDDRACDSSNMISNLYGTAFKRDGTRRYISQAVSSNPINSIFRYYQQNGTEFKKAIIATSRDKMYKSTSDVVPFWVIIASEQAHNQHYSFATMNNRLYATGDKHGTEADSESSFDYVLFCHTFILLYVF